MLGKYVEESMNVILLLLDKNLTILDANRGASEFYKTSIENLKSKKLSDITKNKESIDIRKHNNLENNSFYSKHIIADGTIKYVEIKYSYTSNYLILISITDINNNCRRNCHNNLTISLEKSPYAFFMGDHNGYITYINKSAEFLTGYKLEELIDKHLSFIFTEESIKEKPLRYDLLEKNEKNYSERVIKRKDDTFVNISMLSSRHSDGTYTSFMRNINEEIMIRKKLKESEEKYRAAFYTSPDSVNINRIDGLYVDINIGFTNLTGYTREDVIGKKSSEINIWAIPEDREKLIKGLQKNGYVENLKSKFRCKDGLFKIALMSAKIININNEPHILSVTRDVTDVINIHEEIKIERERLAVTLRSIGDAVITTDVEGNITMLNKVAEKLTGWTTKDAHGKYITEVFRIIHEDTKDVMIDPVKKVLETNEIIELENHTILITKNNHELFIADSGAPIRNSKSETIGVVLVFRDVTEKKMLDEAVQKTQKLEALGVLAGGIAHDFNNLLTGIFGFIDLAKEENKNPVIDEYLKNSISATDKATALTNQLLTFSKGGLPQKSQNDLKKLVEDSLSFTLTGSNITYSFNHSNKDFHSFFDKNQISQVIDNIIINAKQAMPNGGNISVEMDKIQLDEKNYYSLKKGNYISIKIKDSGNGIPKNIINKIFDPFFTTKKKGNGLGLATCYSIVSKHDGIITVNSTYKRGSKFTILLPFKIKGDYVMIDDNNQYFRGSGKIIILDDDEMIKDFLTHKLETLGYYAVSFSKGEDLLKFIEKENSVSEFSAMILDLTIRGGMGGSDIIKTLRDYNKKIPIFVASGYSSDPIMSNPQKYGFTDSIPKPFESNRIISLLRKYLKK